MIKTGDVSHNIFVKGDSFSLRVNSYFNCNGIELPLVRMTDTKMNDTLFNPYSYIGGTYFLTDYFEVSGGFYFPPPPSPVIDTTKEFVRNFIVSFRK